MLKFSNDVSCSINCDHFLDGLVPNTVVEVQPGEKAKGRWYMKITDGKVAGPLTDPFLVGAQWLKTNSRVSPDLQEKICPCPIKTIIAIVKPK